MYKEKYKEPDFKNGIIQLSELNKKAIEAYVEDSPELAHIFTQISVLELQLFPEMIIPEINSRYQKLNLKLCGAGGGGFYLGITKREDIPSLIKEHDVILIE